LKHLKTEIKHLESISVGLDHNEHWNNIETAVTDYCKNFLKNLPNRPSYITVEDPGAGIELSPIEDAPKDIFTLLEIIDKEVTKPGLNPAGGGHLAYIPGGGIPVGALGDYIAAITNKYAGVYYGAPGAVRLENQLIDWMSEFVGYPKTALGNLSSGGSIANLTAIICARDKYGMIGAKAEKAVIYLSQQAHHCVDKSFRMAGLGCAVIREIPITKHYKIDPVMLESQINADKAAGLNPFMVVASAGTTDTGVIDPLKAIGNICSNHNLWFHVDAAYGGFFMLLDELKPLFDGIEMSDSVVLDPHKGLFAPYGSGTVIVKDGIQMKKSFTYAANYMQDANADNNHVSPSEVSPELTKHFRGLRIWLPLQLYGLKPFKDCLQEKILLTRYFYDKIQELNFEVGMYPELSVMTFRYVPEHGNADDFNKQLVDLIRIDGTVFVSSTIINDNFVIRLAVLSFRTHLSAIEELLKQLAHGKSKLLKLTAFNPS